MAKIVLDDVSLTFKIRQKAKLTLKEFLVGYLFHRKHNPVMKVRALDGLSLTFARGDRVGIIGHNGAGKSTLLRLLAGIYPPTAGTVTVDGRVSSLFDIALGFEPNASGWENIAYRSYLQGETPRSVRQKKHAIAEFSELGEFLNMPIRYYSAGMLVRLAFSIATAIEPEILLVDEILSVGDMAFQIKAGQRMTEMIDKAHLMIMVSHDLKSVEKMCTGVIWMDHGRAVRVGPTDEVVAAYRASVEPAAAPAQAA